MRTYKEVQDCLAELIAQAMYMKAEEVEEDKLFSSFGLESLTLLKIVQKVNDKYACSIEVREVLPHQTLKEASTFIFDKIASLEKIAS